MTFDALFWVVVPIFAGWLIARHVPPVTPEYSLRAAERQVARAVKGLEALEGEVRVGRRSAAEALRRALRSLETARIVVEDHDAKLEKRSEGDSLVAYAVGRFRGEVLPLVLVLVGVIGVVKFLRDGFGLEGCSAVEAFVYAGCCLLLLGVGLWGYRVSWNESRKVWERRFLRRSGDLGALYASVEDELGSGEAGSDASGDESEPA